MSSPSDPLATANSSGDDEQTFFFFGLDVMSLLGVAMLVVIMTGAVLVASLLPRLVPSDIKNQQQLTNEARRLQGDLLAMERANESLRKQLADMSALQTPDQKDAKNRFDKPIIVLADAAGYSFPTGKADLSTSFQKKLRDNIVPVIKDYLNKYPVRRIEIIGHTDERPLAARGSNLDRYLTQKLWGSQWSKSQAADNVGLGMMRACAVLRVMRPFVPQHIYVVPLSAGPMIDTRGNVSKGNALTINDPYRRRIEIRLVGDF